jgi:hypothetical protein
MIAPASPSLARRRLSLGITNVGTWVLLSVGGLAWLSSRPADDLGPRLLIVLAACALALQAVGDAFGGLILMPEPRPSLSTFLRRWLRGLLVHTAVLAGVSGVSLLSLRLTGGFGAGIAASMIVLAFGRRQLLFLATGGTSASQSPGNGEVDAVSVDDPAFTGGIAGLGPRARILLPTRWLAALPAHEVVTEVRRREWQRENGLPLRAFALLVAWNVGGAYIGAQIFDLEERTPAVALASHFCWMTLWAFVSLLLLPVLSRRAVFAADRAITDAGDDPRAWITRFPTLIGEDGSPRAAVQAIFYPIPSAARRLRQLSHPPLGVVPGELARNNLFYSWATCTLLGRAVHCNAGRPALWVFPPVA